MNTTPAARYAQRTWSRLGHANQLQAPLGEETLTDLLVLDMLPHRRAKGFWLSTTTKPAEHRCGADLLVAVRHQTGRWSRLALQAKKLNPDDNRYPAFAYVSRSKEQLKKLERFARQLHALPLYLLYNHSHTARCSKHWHCLEACDVGQLGCTLVPSWHILRMLSRRAPPYRNFDRAHKVRQSLPWRCVFDCRFAEKHLIQMAFRTRHGNRDILRAGPPQYDWPFEPTESAWPEWLFQESKTQLTSEDVDRIRRELSDRYDAETAPQDSLRLDERPLYPARLLIVDRFVGTDNASREPQPSAQDGGAMAQCFDR